MGLSSVCPDLEVTTVQTKWSDCWSQGHIGGGLLGAHYHACMTYTHTTGGGTLYGAPTGIQG